MGFGAFRYAEAIKSDKSHDEAEAIALSFQQSKSAVTGRWLQLSEWKLPSINVDIESSAKGALCWILHELEEKEKKERAEAAKLRRLQAKKRLKVYQEAAGTKRKRSKHSVINRSFKVAKTVPSQDLSQLNEIVSRQIASNRQVCNAKGSVKSVELCKAVAGELNIQNAQSVSSAPRTVYTADTIKNTLYSQVSSTKQRCKPKAKVMNEKKVKALCWPLTVTMLTSGTVTYEDATAYLSILKRWPQRVKRAKITGCTRKASHCLWAIRTIFEENRLLSIEYKVDGNNKEQYKAKRHADDDGKTHYAFYEKHVAVDNEGKRVEVKATRDTAADIQLKILK